MARVRCEECGHDFFVAYSCRCRVQSANYSIERYFTEALGIDGGYTGGIYCIHFSLRSMQALPQGSLFNVHSHLHALVPAGIMIAHHFLKTCPTSVPKYSEFTTLPVLKPA